MKILYMGPLDSGGTCLQRLRAMQSLGHQVDSIDTLPKRQSKLSRLVCRVGFKFQFAFDPAGAYARMLAQIQETNYDVLWLDKASGLKASILKRVRARRPELRIVGYSPDDMTARHNLSRRFRSHLPQYDIFFTTKSYNVSELMALGCPRVEFVGNAYDPAIHRPLPIDQATRERLGGGVGFIGSYEPERAKSMLHLAENGIAVRIWGSDWDRFKQSHPNLRIEGRPLWSDDYAAALCAFDINLCFLRKINRDLQTTRSVEIPACSAFMLAERTNEHLDLFSEGQEAEFFNSDEELVSKCRYYLAHPQERDRISRGGYERCLKGGYSNQERLRRMLDMVSQLSKSG